MLINSYNALARNSTIHVCPTNSFLEVPTINVTSDELLDPYIYERNLSDDGKYGYHTFSFLSKYHNRKKLINQNNYYYCIRLLVVAI